MKTRSPATAAVIIDGRVGYVGGAGFQEHFETGEFHDLFVRMTGAVVSQLQLVFLASFRYLGGPPLGDLDEEHPPGCEELCTIGRHVSSQTEQRLEMGLEPGSGVGIGDEFGERGAEPGSSHMIV